jgi:hypothetical protein
MRERIGHPEMDDALNDRRAIPSVIAQESMSLRNSIRVLKKKNVYGVRRVFRKALVPDQAAAA